MKINDKYNKIITDETLRETVCHGNDEYPFRYYIEDIWQFDFHCIDWHWHSEVEFVFVEKGIGKFLIGSEKYILSEGNGIFINTRVTHYFEAENSVVIPNIVFSPSLLSSENSLIYKKYIQPILNSSMECLIFSDKILWQKEALNILRSVFAVQKDSDAREIKTVELLLRLWGIIYENVYIEENISVYDKSAYTQAQLQIMMQYIHENYFNHITLEDIAQTVSLSKSSALNIFNRFLHISPINYTVNYRLKRAAKLLTTTENSVSAIAKDTGFDNVGYFCRQFKKLFQLTPSEYRKKD